MRKRCSDRQAAAACRRNLVDHRLEGGEVQDLFEEGHAPADNRGAVGAVAVGNSCSCSAIFGRGWMGWDRWCGRPPLQLAGHSWRQGSARLAATAADVCKATATEAHLRKERTVGKKAEKSSQKPHVSRANPERNGGSTMGRACSAAGAGQAGSCTNAPQLAGACSNRLRAATSQRGPACTAQKASHLQTSSPTPPAPRLPETKRCPCSSLACGHESQRMEGARLVVIAGHRQQQQHGRQQLRRAAAEGLRSSRQRHQAIMQRVAPREEAQRRLRSYREGHASEEQNLQRRAAGQHGQAQSEHGIVRRAGSTRLGRQQGMQAQLQLTLPMASSPRSKKNSTPRRKNRKPRPVRPTPISAAARTEAQAAAAE